MQHFPAHVSPYKRTDTFDETTVPKGFLKEHNTKAGVWAKLNVESGELIYVITEPGQEEEVVIQAGEFGVIAPEQKHHVQMNAEVKFHVEFYK